MLRRAAEQKLPHHLLLFYSNRRPEDAAFPEEMEELEKENSIYKVIGTRMKAMLGSGFITGLMKSKDDQVETRLRKSSQR
jgi:ferredoxin-NADP reductase